MRSPRLAVPSATPRFVLASLAASLLLAVAGCGGGGGNNPVPADVVDKYIGSWLSTCDVTGPDTSDTELLTLKKNSATTVSFTDTTTTYATDNCSGPGTAQAPATGTATWNGTKTTTAGQTVDRIDISINGMVGIQKQIVMIGSDGKFYSGDGNGPEDANGYPNTLQATGSTKQ